METGEEEKYFCGVHLEEHSCVQKPFKRCYKCNKISHCQETYPKWGTCVWCRASLRKPERPEIFVMRMFVLMCLAALVLRNERLSLLRSLREKVDQRQEFLCRTYHGQTDFCQWFKRYKFERADVLERGWCEYWGYMASKESSRTVNYPCYALQKGWCVYSSVSIDEFTTDFMMLEPCSAGEKRKERERKEREKKSGLKLTDALM